MNSKIYTENELSVITSAFFEQGFSIPRPFGNGHINSTFVFTHGDKSYILQRINTDVFQKPVELMENVVGVTEHIRKKAAQTGGDVARSTLTLIPTLSKKTYYVDADGGFWRVYAFIEGTVAKEQVDGQEDFYSCACAFGEFHRLLSDYPADRLHETIENFHNTPVRYKNLIAAIAADPYGRVAQVGAEIEFAKAREAFCHTLEDAYASGQLPLRVTHNDTKLNNILFDAESGLPVCVIDLDTVMPGYSVNDFGDSIRFGANTAAEDETDLCRVSLDLSLFAAFARGFIQGSCKKLAPCELEMLPIGAMMMTLECGMRFLTDYILGDVYFKIHRPSHNLDRCRCQFALLADMERKLPDMRRIIAELA